MCRHERKAIKKNEKDIALGERKWRIKGWRELWKGEQVRNGDKTKREEKEKIRIGEILQERVKNGST